MTTEIINSDRFADLQVWNGEVGRHRKESHSLSGKGYRLFLGISNKLPNIKSLPEIHWTGLSEGQSEFVSVGDHEKLSLDDMSLERWSVDES